MKIPKAFRALLHPFLYFFNPSIAALTQSIVGGDPSAIADWASTTRGHAQGLHDHAQQFADQAANTGSSWEGEAGETFRQTASRVSSALGVHAQEVNEYAQTAQKLSHDFGHLVETVNHGQTQAEATVKVLAAVPFVGHGLATAYALKTFVWTGLCAKALIDVGHDFSDVVSEIDGHHVRRSWTPPDEKPMTQANTIALEEHHDQLPFGASSSLQDA